jgi:HD-like signal output (HDOD) protein
LNRIVNRTKSVYTLPVICERLAYVINNPRSSIADITRVIPEDQGLSARLLNMANSPLFVYFSKIDSIGMAAKKLNLGIDAFRYRIKKLGFLK